MQPLQNQRNTDIQLQRLQRTIHCSKKPATNSTHQQRLQHGESMSEAQIIETVEAPGQHTLTLKKYTNYANKEAYTVTDSTPKMKHPKTVLLGTNPANARAYLANLQENYIAREQRKQEYKQQCKEKAKEFSAAMKKGALLYTSWGYDQTNIDYYEVLEVKGQFVTLREVLQERKEDGFMCGRCVPIPGAYSEREPILKRRIMPGYVKINSCAHAWLWDGTPKGYSTYA